MNQLVLMMLMSMVAGSAQAGELGESYCQKGDQVYPFQLYPFRPPHRRTFGIKYEAKIGDDLTATFTEYRICGNYPIRHLVLASTLTPQTLEDSKQGEDSGSLALEGYINDEYISCVFVPNELEEGV